MIRQYLLCNFLQRLDVQGEAMAEKNTWTITVTEENGYFSLAGDGISEKVLDGKSVFEWGNAVAGIISQKMNKPRVHIDMKNRLIIRPDATIPLIAKEYELLDFFFQHEGEIITRAQLFQNIWEMRVSDDDKAKRMIDKKLELEQTASGRSRQVLDIIRQYHKETDFAYIPESELEKHLFLYEKKERFPDRLRKTDFLFPGEYIAYRKFRESLKYENYHFNQKVDVDSRTLDVHISRLREKLGERSDSYQIIQTVRGVGYKFVAP